ncbi:MAG: AAA family ATPase [Oscillospiraceae bacterium]|nr:AAA family ATPase [Oscillospiraceae bacterium]
MKLISIYIENFGCLHQYGLEFAEGLTVIRKDNGFGKTTLAEFIRAMFYGFPRAAKTLDKNRRKRYLPWSGGKCGGHLTFEQEGCRYRIQRTFGTVPKGDTFSLIDLSTNQKSNRFSEDIGVELFGLDADSFERSTYMPQLHETGALSTDSIRAKLGDLVEDTNDVGNFEKAVAALRAKRMTYSHFRGIGGSVAEAKSKVSQLQQKLDEAEEQRSTLASRNTGIRELEDLLDRDEQELAQIREKITEGSQAAAREAVRREYRRLLEQRDQLQSGLDVRFDAGMPGAEDFEKADSACAEYLTVTAQIRDTAPAPAELGELEAFFGPGIPEDEKLEDLSQKQRQLMRLQAELDSLHLSDPEQHRLEELQSCFASGLPEQKQIDDSRMKLDRADRLRQEIPQLREALQAREEKQKGSPWTVIALILGVLALGGGIGLLAAGKVIPGGVLLGVGLPLILLGAWLGIRRMISKEVSGNGADLRQQLAAAQTEASRLEWEVQSFVGQYLVVAQLAQNLDEIQNRRTEYLALVQRAAGLEKSRSRIQAELDECQGLLYEALAPYFGAEPEAEQSILTLRMKRSRLQDLRQQQASADEKRTVMSQRARELEAQLRAFLEPYYETVAVDRFGSLLNQLRRSCDDQIRIRNQLSTLEQKLAEFRAEHGAVLSQREQIPDLELLKHRERQLSDEITDLTRRLLERKQQAAQLRHEIDRIPELRDELESWQSRKDADQNRADTLDRTLDFLQQARENLSGNYLSTIQRSFGQYLERLSGEDRQKILVTGDLEVQLERQGQTRELGYFSAGQTDLVMLCMRFALVDALFTEEKPFVILDDPFVNLDDARTAEALALLKDLSQDRQIIYLVCNSSRI